MANMSYCQFTNTYQGLRQCFDAMEDDLSEEEAKYKVKLIALCKRIVENYGEDEE